MIKYKEGIKFEDMINQVIWGDCLEVMRMMPDKCVDLVVTDPPYNIGKDYGNDSDKQNEDDYWAWMTEIGKESSRVLKEKGWILVINGVTKITGTIQAFSELTHIWTACWYAPNKVSHSVYGFNLWQPIMIFRKEKAEWLKHQDFYSYTTGQEKWGHPTPKPINLISKLIIDFSNENDLILDFFLGSGTTA